MVTLQKDKTTIENWLVNWVATNLEIEEESIEPDEPFVNLGLSSRQAVFMAGELGDVLEGDIELEPGLAWEYPTIRKLSEFLADN